MIDNAVEGRTGNRAAKREYNRPNQSSVLASLLALT